MCFCSYMCVHVHLCLQVCACVFACPCLRACTCVSVCVCVCLPMCQWSQILRTHTRTHTSRGKSLRGGLLLSIPSSDKALNFDTLLPPIGVTPLTPTYLPVSLISSLTYLSALFLCKAQHVGGCLVHGTALIKLVWKSTTVLRQVSSVTLPLSDVICRHALHCQT